ncbi:MAG: 4-(cytidine 5'-diphospho)-2-C-methyl-D-erythritol kinase [Deltaproteobacteria bacterium]|uniref:4-diphosphocytidyl-2-C-methyl-D-erythritol kinase n=1 Tax=Candidatus Zymogenus saltonus TaxID=2844893 RepID=A0A9D8KFE6_9DELT|nr:4-(cytidine 5'-diphospho)-2-C-methyl-D-erythritol kinase [Candidatus Zymogenus saltonus]
MSEILKFKSPAKVNYFLKVGEKLPNGYHKIATVMSAIDIYDHITVAFEGSRIEIESDNTKVPQGPSNTVYRAIEALLKEANVDIGIKVNIQKNIPLESGLGGASSNAASVMLKLNDHLNLGLGLDELLTLGVKIGSDVPFFIFGSPALVTGIGENLKKIEGIPETWMVVVKPPGSVSTKLAYKMIDLVLTFNKKSIIIPKFNGTLGGLIEGMVNDFETVVGVEPIVNDKRNDRDRDGGGYSVYLPEVGRIKREIERLGSLKAMLTGSGSSVFGVFGNRIEAKRAFEEIRSKNDWTVFLAQNLFY